MLWCKETSTQPSCWLAQTLRLKVPRKFYKTTINILVTSSTWDMVFNQTPIQKY
jgi:hypothetical protein